MNTCIDTYGGMVWSIARKFARLDHDAEDLVQEIFMSLWRNAEKFDAARGAEATFIGMLARRRSIDWLRKQGRRLDLEPLSEAITEPRANVTHPAFTADRDALKQALGRLPDETQRLFRSHFEQGLSHREIADKTGVALGTVKTRLRNGLIELRRQLNTHDTTQQPEATA